MSYNNTNELRQIIAFQKCKAFRGHMQIEMWCKHVCNKMLFDF